MYCTANCFRILTHVYCHHQEVTLLNSSTELNSSLQAKTSPWEQKNKNNTVSTSKSFAIFLQRGTHNISLIAQKLWQNRTQVVVSTQSFFSPQHRCHRFCYLFNLYLTRMVSWDWHILFFENSWQTNNTKAKWCNWCWWISLSKSCECPDVSLMPFWEQNHKSAAVEEFLSVWWWRSLMPSHGVATRQVWVFAEPIVSGKDHEHFEDKARAVFTPWWVQCRKGEETVMIINFNKRGGKAAVLQNPSSDCLCILNRRFILQVNEILIFLKDDGHIL